MKATKHNTHAAKVDCGNAETNARNWKDTKTMSNLKDILDATKTGTKSESKYVRKYVEMPDAPAVMLAAVKAGSVVATLGVNTDDKEPCVYVMIRTAKGGTIIGGGIGMAGNVPLDQAESFASRLLTLAEQGRTYLAARK